MDLYYIRHVFHRNTAFEQKNNNINWKKIKMVLFGGQKRSRGKGILKKISY